MFVKIFRLIRGYLLITMKGGSPERFINMCNNKNIYIWNLKNIDGIYQFEIFVKDYKKLKPIAKKTHIIPSINKKIGLPFIMHGYKKRKAFLLGLFLFSLLIYLLSLNIWNITINGGRNYTKETLIQYLETQDIYIGKKINDIDCRAIEDNIRETYTDIGWVSAQIRGTNLIIDLKESQMPEEINANAKPRHIIASKEGIITYMVTRTGTPLVELGDVVKKGDILVSGVLDIIGDNELLIAKEPVVADADIKAKTYYEYQDDFLLNYIDKEYTDNSKKDYTISVFLKEINLIKHGNLYANYDIITDELIMQPFTDFYLPFSLRLVYYDEYKEIDKKYTNEEARNIAKTNLYRLINKLKENNVIILDNDITTDITKDSCTTKGNIIVEESIIDYKEIFESEWRIEEEDELIRDSD